MSTTSKRLGKQAKNVTEDIEEIGETVSDAAQEKIRQVGEKASEYLEQGRDKVCEIARPCEQFLQQRPLVSVLIAGGVGWLLGRFFKLR